MKITILCSDASHPVNEPLTRWAERKRPRNAVEILRSVDDAIGGDILFLISCSEIIKEIDRARYKKTLVIHASDLPEGRGWSPHLWQIVAGAKEITVTLLEASDKIDSGMIWRKVRVPISVTSLYSEINRALFDAEMELMDYAVANLQSVHPVEQDATVEATYYRKRTSGDSRVDAQKSIAEQFDGIRVCDPLRFPAFFELRGCRYKLTIERY